VVSVRESLPILSRAVLSFDSLVPGGSFLRGVFESLAVIAGFVAFGLIWAAAEGGAEGSMPAGERETPDVVAEATAPKVWLVDGYNVLHAGVLRGRDRRGWWTAAVQARLVAVAETFDDAGAEIVVVFDAREPELAESAAALRLEGPAPPSRVRLVYAPSADDWLVKQVRSAAEPGRIAVVTGDRQVQGRARHRGAQVIAPLAFLARCDRSAGEPPA
jgi:predicted RNA-binding protein with PIN domain